MVRTLATGCLVLMLTAVALAGTIVIDFGTPVTLTSNANQNAFLAAALASENAARAARNPPANALTLEQFIQQMLLSAWQQLKQSVDAGTRQDACTNFQALSGAQQTAIATTLGGKSPCP